jgi:hypothetical protein
MTDHDLAQALEQAASIEDRARAEWQKAQRSGDAGERDDALVGVRQATALRRILQRWISNRAVRAIRRS